MGYQHHEPLLPSKILAIWIFYGIWGSAGCTDKIPVGFQTSGTKVMTGR